MSKEAEEVSDDARRKRIASFPTVVMETPRAPEYSASPYPDWLVKVRCRGIPGDLKQDFAAVFHCVGARAPLEAAGLRKGMRLRLDRVPLEDRPANTKPWPMVDDVDDFSLPVFWVTSFQHDEPELTLAPQAGRARLAALADQTVLKAPTMIPCGDAQVPFFFYGANWGIYKADAPERLTGLRPGSPALAVMHLHHWLQKRGIRLVFAPIPQSASIFPDVVLGRFDGTTLKGDPANTPVRQMLEHLRNEGVSVIDFTSELIKLRMEQHEGKAYPAYLPNDTHWSSGGAMIAAVQAARFLIEEGLVPKPSADEGAAPFREIRSVHSHEGDMGNVSAVVNLQVKVDAVPALFHQVHPTSEQAKKLLEDPGPDALIHCVGDSYLVAHRGEQAGFADHLVEETGLQVHVVAGFGCGHHAAMRGWLREGAGQAKVLLWMPSERYLAYDEWIDVLSEPAALR
jgi:hypothetical protein